MEILVMLVEYGGNMFFMGLPVPADICDQLKSLMIQSPNVHSISCVATKGTSL